MIEPLNSYEVSWIIHCYKPKWPLGIKEADLFRIIGRVKSDGLLKWAKHHATHGWLVDKYYLAQ